MIHVLAGILADEGGRVLIAQRPPGKHLAGMWEFPGGKRADGEDAAAALARELDEELGVHVLEARPLIRYVHDYPDRRIDLDVWRVERFVGQPEGREGQRLDWERPERLMAHDLLPADRPVVEALSLPSRYAVTGTFSDKDDFMNRLRAALSRGAGLIQLRAHGAAPEHLESLLCSAVPICHAADARIVVNGHPGDVGGMIAESGADGVHLPSRHLRRAGVREAIDGGLVGASCHDAEELALAQAIGAHFAVLGPVQPTPSHPESAGLGWDRFRELVAPVRIPVYAIGGLSLDDMPLAWHEGAQGIAGISSFWTIDHG